MVVLSDLATVVAFAFLNVLENGTVADTTSSASDSLFSPSVTEG